jgi:hypothetical protein
MQWRGAYGKNFAASITYKTSRSSPDGNASSNL